MKRYISTYLLRKGYGEGDSILPSWLYKLGSQYLIDTRFPTHIYLELSRSCNYHCKMCARKEKDYGYMPVSVAEKVINESKKYGPTSFSLHLYGEPLLSPNWELIIKLIKQANKHNTILLTTNGSMLTQSVSKIIIDLGVDIVYISIPSINYVKYYNMTGGDLIKVLHNTKDFIKTRGDKKVPQLITRTYDNDMPYFPLCDRVIFRDYHNFGGGNMKYTQYNLKDRYPCYHPWFTVAVTYKGDYNICCSDADNKILLGNVSNKSISEVWKSDKVNELRRMHLNNEIVSYHKCRDCDVWNVKPDIFYNWQKGNNVRHTSYRGLSTEHYQTID